MSRSNQFQFAFISLQLHHGLAKRLPWMLWRAGQGHLWQLCSWSQLPKRTWRIRHVKSSWSRCTRSWTGPGCCHALWLDKCWHHFSFAGLLFFVVSFLLTGLDDDFFFVVTFKPRWTWTWTMQPNLIGTCLFLSVARKDRRPTAYSWPCASPGLWRLMMQQDDILLELPPRTGWGQSSLSFMIAQISLRNTDSTKRRRSLWSTWFQAHVLPLNFIGEMLGFS